jgi:hypothetical protein
MKLAREISATAKASHIREFYREAVELRSAVDKFKYDHTFPTSVGKGISTAINSLEAAKVALREAGSEMAWEALEGDDE